MSTVELMRKCIICV